MKQYTIACAMLLAFATGMAQTPAPVKTKTGWELGGGATFGTTFSLFLDGKPPGYITNTNPAPVLQFSTGVFARKFFLDQFGIEFGAQYSSFGLRRATRMVMVDGNGMPVGEAYFNNRRRYAYVEMPVRFVYKKNVGKVSLGCFAGVSPAVLIASHGTETTNAGSGFGNGQVGQSGSLKDETTPFNLFADVGMLIRTDVYKNLYFEAKPHLRASTIPQQKDSNIHTGRELMAGVGVNLAVGWQF